MVRPFNLKMAEKSLTEIKRLEKKYSIEDAKYISSKAYFYFKEKIEGETPKIIKRINTEKAIIKNYKRIDKIIEKKYGKNMG